MLRLEGNPRNIGGEYGRRLAEQIVRNLEALVAPETELLADENSGVSEWIARHESLLEAKWPWLIEEMRGTAEGANIPYRDILMLNLRVWQYEYYGGVPKDSDLDYSGQTSAGCSSLAITVADGTIANAGALDDPVELYCGPVHYIPESGYRFITFPLAGSSWGNRGMNSAGLSIGVSSQILPGMPHPENSINQDLALRILLQTCATVDEVREFCLGNPFTINLVCVDAQGGQLCAHQTPVGFFEFPVQGSCVLTNHVSDDGLIQRLHSLGVRECFEHPTSRLRRGNLLSFAKSRAGKCFRDEICEFISRRDDASPASIHNAMTAYLTYSNPQVYPNTYWVSQPKSTDDDKGFMAFSI